MKRFSILATVSLLALALTLPATVSASSHQGALLTNVPVTGTLADGGTFTGVVSITEVALNSAGQLVFDGTLVGTATQGTTTTPINQAFELVVGTLTEPDAGVCDILFLDLGPLFLDVLGLTVDLSQITLDVNAVPGPGNLLGNLLCAVAGLLDNGGPLSGLTNLLRAITRILG